MLFRSNDLLIVAINLGNFSTKYNAKVGDSIKFSFKEAKAYLSEYLLRQLKRTNERSDYASDSIFANFRSVVTTGIKPGVLYRGSSPINNEIGRAAYSNALAEAVGVKTVLNLADNAENIKTVQLEIFTVIELEPASDCCAIGQALGPPSYVIEKAVFR